MIDEQYRDFIKNEKKKIFCKLYVPLNNGYNKIDDFNILIHNSFNVDVIVENN